MVKYIWSHKKKQVLVWAAKLFFCRLYYKNYGGLMEKKEELKKLIDGIKNKKLIEYLFEFVSFAIKKWE